MVALGVAAEVRPDGARFVAWAHAPARALLAIPELTRRYVRTVFTSADCRRTRRAE